MRRFLTLALLAGLLPAAALAADPAPAPTPAPAPEATAPAASDPAARPAEITRASDSRCLRSTGSHMRARPGRCLGYGTVITRSDINRSGTADLGSTLVRRVPAVGYTSR